MQATEEILFGLALELHQLGFSHAVYRIFQGSGSISLSHLPEEDRDKLKELKKDLKNKKVNMHVYKKKKLPKSTRENLKHRSDVGKINPHKASDLAHELGEKYFRLASTQLQDVSPLTAAS